jgi:hypothetical protein
MPSDNLPMKDAQAAKRRGELHESDDPRISEWGNPARVTSCHGHLNT